MKKIFLAAGHGGSDPGTVANGLYEKDLNLYTLLACQAELNKYKDVEVQVNRTTDIIHTTGASAEKANKFNADLAVEIHHNAGGGDGVEVYYESTDSVSKAAAKTVVDAIVAIGQNSRGTKTGDAYIWMRECKRPCILVECAFLDNKNDVKIVDTRAENEVMGRAIANGIAKYFGLVKKEEPKKEEETPAIKVGDVIQFLGGNQYLGADSANPATTGLKAGPAKVTIIYDGKHPYHVVHTDNQSAVYGWVDASQVKVVATKEEPKKETTTTTTTTKPTTATSFKVGDIVQFLGGKHYASTTATIPAASGLKAGPAKVTAKATKGKHLYHIVHTDSKSSVYGWVDASSIKALSTTTTTTTKPANTSTSTTFKKGDKVKVKKGAKTYEGGSLASYVYTMTFEVIEVSKQRVVIGLNGVVTAAVNSKDLTKV